MTEEESIEENKNLIKVVTPPNYGWLEKKLTTVEIDYLWKCIENRSKKSHKHYLAGNIHESNQLTDVGDWFFNNTLKPLCKIYSEEFSNIGSKLPVSCRHPYQLESFWVNYQKENNFNPTHDHIGVYSFVVWMEIPTKHEEQNTNPLSNNSNTPAISTFQFLYTDILGKITEYRYKMNPEVNGTILFFPSSLIHSVNPFYNCKEDRISISGNISLNSSIIL